MPPRIRSLKPECWQDEALGTVSRDARLLFVALITQADDDGRLKGALPLVRSQAFPYDHDLDLSELEGWLNELSVNGLVVRYRVDGKAFIALPTWHKHQRINRPTPSQIPPPDEDSVKAHGTIIEASPPDQDQDRKGSGGDRKSEVTPSDAPLSHLLADLVEQNGSKRPTVTQRWADAERLLLTADKRPADEAERLVRWCQASEFWRGNVLSMPKFRERYDTLRLQMARNGGPPAPRPRERRYTHLQNPEALDAL